MEVSILIVSKNRADELNKTLNILVSKISHKSVEVLVCLDGCTDNSKDLKRVFPWVIWFENKFSQGASKARNILYQKAKGNILIGLDDDAHPVDNNFIEKTIKYFSSNPNLAVLAFNEIRGVFDNDNQVKLKVDFSKSNYKVSEFVGCGFAILKTSYDETNGFPKWMDIYGEESCVSIELLDLGYELLWVNDIVINHRVDLSQRKKAGKNYFRFKKQLINSNNFFVVYYRYPFKAIMKCFIHNFITYALADKIYFKLFFQSLFEFFKKLPKVIKFRSPVKQQTIQQRRRLKSLF